MDHNGLYTDLDSFNINNCGTTNNNFNDTCLTLPSLNNFKYQQTNLSSNINQPAVHTIHDQHNSSTKSSSSSSILPPTQININNCNSNIFFPHDDGIFDTSSQPTCATTTIPNNGHGNNQKNNFIGHVRKELGATGGGDNSNPLKNVYFNINNINTNIVNNIQNPANFVNGTDSFGGNQYHQINKSGETVINFMNNNLNSAGNSMPADTVSATSQNYYQTNNNNSHGQQTVYETSVQSQSNTFVDPNTNATKSSMGMSGPYHGHPQNTMNQSMPNGSYLPGNANLISPENAAPTMGPYNEYSETLSTAKIINNFESKNPLKYPTSNRYYKNAADYSAHQYASVNHMPPPGPLHNYPGLYSNATGIPPKIPAPQNYEPYPRYHRNSAPHHYPGQHYTVPPQTVHTMDDHSGSRLNYNRPTGVPVHPAYHPHTMPHPTNGLTHPANGLPHPTNALPHPTNALPHPTNGYGNYYSNAMPFSTYPPQMPSSPYVSHLIRNENCSKTSTNYNKTGAIALSPVEHGSSYAMPHDPTYSTPKKDFFPENHYFPPAHPYYEDPMNNSCAKKTNSRLKAGSDVYNINSGATSIYPDQHLIPHYPQNGNMMRNVNVGYQPVAKHFSDGNSYSMPPSNSCDLANPYHNINYHYKNGDVAKLPKMNPAVSNKQFKNYGHYEPMPAHPASYVQPQYPTMHAKHPEKIKISIDLEEQINSSKIPKLRDPPHPSYGYNPHHYYPYHYMQTRNPTADNDPKNSIANINISLRDFLKTWNDFDDEETGERRQASGTMDNLNEHMERTIVREFNPMFVQKATDSFMNATDVPQSQTAQKPQQLSEIESGIINEGTEKLYVLESIDVPLSELNKYKHLSVINKLPENVVINDKEYTDDSSLKFIEEIDISREKLYKSEFELEFEACQERKIHKPLDERPEDQKIAVTEVLETEETLKVPNTEESSSPEKKKTLTVKTPKMKNVKTKLPKIKQTIIKLKKEKILKAVSSKDPRKVRITKRLKKYSLNQQTSSVKTLKSICVDFVNTSAYRNYARQQLSIINKHSKMRILKDFKKKFNFDGLKRTNSTVNQKSNHSIRINSLREICGKVLDDEPKVFNLKEGDEDLNVFENQSDEESQKVLESSVCMEETSKDFEENVDDTENTDNVSISALNDRGIMSTEGTEYLYSPLTLKELCETFIYSHQQYFVIEEVSNVPKLQELCKSVLSETNIFINIDEEANQIFTLEEEAETLRSSPPIDAEPIYIFEENSGNVGELFESTSLNSFEKSEILRKIQRVANIDDEDEIIRAIGALHRDDDDESINNNNSNVSNKNISCTNRNIFEFSGTNDETKFDSEMSFMSLIDDDLVHSVQYEEIISGKKCLKSQNKHLNRVISILRHKYLNRSDLRQASKTIKSILKKSLAYQRADRFRNEERREQVNVLRQKSRAALLKLQESKNSDNFSSGTESTSSDIESSTDVQVPYTPETESQNDAKEAHSDQKSLNYQSPVIINDSPVDDINCFDNLDAHAELNFPQLPSVFPSINEYKIDRKGSNRCDVKDICSTKRRKMTFDESLLSIEKMYEKPSGENHEESSHHEKTSHNRNDRRSSASSSSSRTSHREERRHDKKRHHSRSRNSNHHSSRSHERRKTSSHRLSHHSSRHNNYKNDQMKHSETKRLVIPSYKLYDKDLDVKLKIMPFVRIEREEKVDDLVKMYN